MNMWEILGLSHKYSSHLCLPQFRFSSWTITLPSPESWATNVSISRNFAICFIIVAQQKLFLLQFWTIILNTDDNNRKMLSTKKNSLPLYFFYYSLPFSHKYSSPLCLPQFRFSSWTITLPSPESWATNVSISRNFAICFIIVAQQKLFLLQFWTIILNTDDNNRKMLSTKKNSPALYFLIYEANFWVRDLASWIILTKKSYQNKRYRIIRHFQWNTGNNNRRKRGLFRFYL